MKIYEIHDAEAEGFAYAQGYGELAHPIPFLVGERLDRRREFWKINPRPPGLFIENKGSKWGDFMLCGSGLPSMVIGERVITAIKQLRHEIMTETEFPIGAIGNKKLKTIPPPRYYAVQWVGGIEVDWRATGVEHDDAGNPIIVLGKVPNRVAKLSTWNGADIFSWTNWDSTHLTMLCTERVVELSEKEKWTNVRFDPVPTS